MAKMPIKGTQFTEGQIKNVDPNHRANKTHLINHKYAHLGLSVPSALPMGGAVSEVVPSEGYGRKSPVTGERAPKGTMTTVKDGSHALQAEGFNSFFKHPTTGKLMPEIQDMDGLRKHPGFELMVQRNIAEYHKVSADPVRAKAADDFYPNEKRQVAEVGRRFNEARAAKGMKTYFPEKPELAGALLQGGYSQNNDEANRARLVEKTAATGELQPHLSTVPNLRTGHPGLIPHAIENDVHPLDAFGTKKLRDFTGSILHPESWSGSHNGVTMGSGYTIDRHQHDTAMGRDFGNLPLSLSGSEASPDHRRYRIMQAALQEAHVRTNPNLSPSQFQSRTWTGHF